VLSTLRTIASAQAAFQQAGCADEDADGSGEYGGFRELSGASAGRLPEARVPSLLGGLFRTLDGNAEVAHAGYRFKVWLPRPGGAGQGEDPLAGYLPGAGLSPDLCESTWCCYAWPANYEEAHGRTYFVNQSGAILACDVPDWSGAGAGPPPDAAFATSGSMVGPPDVGGPGQCPDGQTWRSAE
jgi:hypothetical protein